jgi:hypothetical protein
VPIAANVSAKAGDALPRRHGAQSIDRRGATVDNRRLKGELAWEIMETMSEIEIVF